MTGDGAVRADVWLWRARFFKTRGLAAAFIAAGKARVESGGPPRRLEKPAAPVRPGDLLTFPLRGRIVRLRILAPGVRRGPAAEARALYELLDDANGAGDA
ncbi:MAG: RNA-binding S4 domain-containing protein [Maricaulaceae bacterium]|nr:RNA-binding S4 domain-containing protein [Maricaulaceae bacterium]